MHPLADLRLGACPFQLSENATSRLGRVKFQAPKKCNMTFLEEASKVINGTRAEDYGSAEKNFKRIADLWTAILGHPVSVEEFAQCMIAVKLGRLSNSPDHRDSWVDIAGYVGCVGQIHDERNKQPSLLERIGSSGGSGEKTT